MYTYRFILIPNADPELERIVLDIRRDTYSHAYNTAVTVAYQLGLAPGDYTFGAKKIVA